jgi:hypothetical protein
MSALDLTNWDPLMPHEVERLLDACPAPWWIAGGFAIDAFVGRFDRRVHGDVDVGLLARDQELVRAELEGWELYCADPPGTLRAWHAGEHLDEPIHDVWARPSRLEPWKLALVLNPSDGDEWVYRRDARITRHLSEITWERDGTRYLAPEVQLLFKSKGMRPQDRHDFDDAAPLLGPDQRAWLKTSLGLVDPKHPWLGRL